MRVRGVNYLTAICAVAENNGLIYGSGTSPRLNRLACLSLPRDIGRGGPFA
jgi:hypothetical protein